VPSPLGPLAPGDLSKSGKAFGGALLPCDTTWHSEHQRTAMRRPFSRSTARMSPVNATNKAMAAAQLAKRLPRVASSDPLGDFARTRNKPMRQLRSDWQN
jgi:hypothetical protein